MSYLLPGQHLFTLNLNIELIWLNFLQSVQQMKLDGAASSLTPRKMRALLVSSYMHLHIFYLCGIDLWGILMLKSNVSLVFSQQ